MWPGNLLAAPQAAAFQFGDANAVHRWQSACSWGPGTQGFNVATRCRLRVCCCSRCFAASSLETECCCCCSLSCIAVATVWALGSTYWVLLSGGAAKISFKGRVNHGWHDATGAVPCEHCCSPGCGTAVTGQPRGVPTCVLLVSQPSMNRTCSQLSHIQQCYTATNTLAERLQACLAGSNMADQQQHSHQQPLLHTQPHPLNSARQEGVEQVWRQRGNQWGCWLD